MRMRFLWAVLLSLACASAVFGQSAETRVRRVLLTSRHLGAHGLGYNSQSMWQLSNRLSAADIPVLIDLAGASDISVGAQFALASQCQSSILPVRDAAVQHKISFVDANDVLQLMSEFEGCSPDTRKQAAEMRASMDRLRQEDAVKREQEARLKAADDARIQANGLKMLDPAKAQTLTREERLEIFRRSLAAMGLSENGPLTPDQKKLVDRMYRSMVLGETQPSNQ